MITGSPPGRFAPTFSVGYSTAGRSLIGSARYATTPNSAIAAIIRLVAIGRRIKVSEEFTALLRYFVRRVYLISTLFHSGTAPKLKKLTAVIVSGDGC